jgi:hypothetical protein
LSALLVDKEWQAESIKINIKTMFFIIELSLKSFSKIFIIVLFDLNTIKAFYLLINLVGIKQ